VMRVFTARYSNPAVEHSILVPVRITRGFPRFKLRYTLGGTVMELAPERALFNLPDEEFDAAYRRHLDQVGVDAIRRWLEAVSEANGGRDLVLLCFEDLRRPGEGCHRRKFAEFWQEKTGEVVEELEELGAVTAAKQETVTASAAHF